MIKMMKQRCVLLFFLLIATVVVRADNQVDNQTDPLLVVVLMVKNEALVMRETLRPYVEAAVHNTEKNTGKKLSFFIFDTGSTDNTMQIAQQYFDEHRITNAVIKQENFIDFATSRNRGLQLAQEAFPHAHFMLMPDAEWYMHNVESLLQFCELNKNDTCPSYLVRIMNPSIDFYTPRLIRCKSGVHFVGSVHEVLNKASVQKVSHDCFFEWRAEAQGREKSQKRWVRDLGLLLHEHEKNPHDTRPVFYIAQTYECLNDLQNARAWYERRITMPGWDEENFIARYRLAQICENLGDWAQAQCHYFKAFSMRPCRAEPLIRLAQHYLQSGEVDLCFLFSRRAVEIPYPDTDILFIDKELYDYTRHDLLGISAWYVGQFELGKKAVLQALQARPDAPHLRTNLNFYV